ncbi:class I SAM-dependent methyltransferase [Nocardia sp. NBC_01730]|uniref:class I SAM-dependent methyltransferase n=1 Tax=Nocardia sp. NBC_01730 TaxID=2975998 RepID=UPI002E113877|nr:class I SAM-dependent methyltransferase [Nocardia sp. NBC_01730]
MTLSKNCAVHFAHPRGIRGAVAGVVMAHRRDYTSRGKWAMGKLEPAPDAHVLELGYGPGVTLAELCRLAPDGRVVGVDLSPVMLRQATRRTRTFVSTGLLDLRHADAADLDPELRDFDLIYGINVWQYWDDGATVIKDLATRLRPGGRLSLAYEQPPGSTVTCGRAIVQMVEQFAATPLVHVQSTWMPGHPAVLVSASRSLR